MPKYKTSSGDIYNIPETEVQSFLSVYPDAVLVEEQGKEKGLAKETAPAGPMTEAQQKAVDTVSVLEDTSSELPETKIDPIKWKDSKPSEKAKMLQEEYGDQFKFDFNDPTDPRTVTVSSANGAEQIFNLESFDQARGGYMSPESYTQEQESEIQEFEKFFIENASNEDEAYNFITAGIKPDDYANLVTTTTVPTGFNIGLSEVSGSLDLAGTTEVISPRKVDARQQRELIDVTQGEVQKMYKDPSSYGIVDMPAFYSAGFDAYTEEEKHKNLDLVYQRVKENTGLNIDKDSFVQIYDNIFRTSTQEAAAQIDAEQNSMALSQEIINPDFEKQMSAKIEEDLDYSPAEKRKKLLNDKKQELLKEKADLEARLNDAEGVEQVNQIRQNIAQVEGNITKIDADIQKNAKVLTISNPRMAEVNYVIDPQLASQYFDRQTQAAEAYVGGVQANNPTMTRYEAVQQAYNNRILQLQFLQSQSTEEKITLDLKPDKGRSTTGAENKYYSSILSKLRKNGYDLDDSGKTEVSLFNLISLGIKPDDLNGVGVKTDEKDVLKYRMFKETYDDDYTNAKAIKRLLDLQEAPEDIKKETGLKNLAQNALISISRDIFGADPETQEKIATLGQGERSRLILDRLNEVAAEENILYNDEIIKFTKEDLEAFERTFMESVTEGTGQMTGTLLEIMAIQAMSGGVLNATGAAQILSNLKKGDKFARAYYHLTSALIEETNMQLAGFKPTSGAAFYTVGALNRYLSPFKQRLRSFDPIYQKATAGPSGAVAMEFAGITENLYDDLMDNKDFSAAFNELYGDLDEVTKRMMVNSMMFGALQIPHIKKTDWMSTGAKIDARTNITKERKDLESRLPFIEIPAEKTEMQAKIDGLVKAEANLDMYIAQETGAADLNPKSPTFEADLNRLYVEPINKVLKEKMPDFKGMTVRVGSGEAFRANNDFEFASDTAVWNDKTNEVFVDISRPGDIVSRVLHEATHGAMSAYFEANPSARKSFNKKMGEIFSNQVLGRDYMGNRFEGRDLTNRIEKEYKEEKLTEEQKSEEYIANMIEMLTQPEFYFTEVAPTFISELRQEFRRRQDYAGLDATPIPQTAKELVQYFADLGYQARTGGGTFNASIFAQLDEIDLFMVESGDAAALKRSKNAEQRASVMKSKDSYDNVNKTHEELVEWREKEAERSARVFEREADTDKAIEIIDRQNAEFIQKHEEKILAAAQPTIVAAANKRFAVNGEVNKGILRGGRTYNEFKTDLESLYLEIYRTYDPAKDKNNIGVARQTSNLFNLRTYAEGGKLADKGPLTRETVDQDLESIISKNSGYNYYASEKDVLLENFENQDLSPAARRKAATTIDGLIDLTVDLNISEQNIEKIVDAIDKSGIKQEDINYKTLQAFNAEGNVSNEIFLDAIGLTIRYPETAAKRGQVDKKATTQAQVEWLQNPQNAELLHNILPLQLRVTPTGLSQATGIKKSVLDRYYIKGTERAKSRLGASTSGPYPQVKVPLVKDGVFDHAKFLDILMPGGVEKLSAGDATVVNALFAEMGKATYNQVYRFKILADKATKEQLEAVKDGSSDRLKSKLSEFQKTIESQKTTVSEKRRAAFAILEDPDITDQEKVNFINSIDKAFWNQNMADFNERVVRDLKLKYKDQDVLNAEIISSYMTEVKFLETRRQTEGIYDSNPGINLPKDNRTKGQYEVALENALSLIPKDKTFATSSSQVQKAILNTLGSSHSNFTIDGQRITKKNLGKGKSMSDAQLFDKIMELSGVYDPKVDAVKPSEIKGKSSKTNEYNVTSGKIYYSRKKFEQRIEEAEKITDETERNLAIEKAIELFKQESSVEGKTYKESQQERQDFLVDFYENLTNQIINAKTKEAQMEILNGAFDLLQLQTSRGTGIVRDMIPFKYLTTEYSVPEANKAAYRVEHFLPIAKITDNFIKSSIKFINSNGNIPKYRYKQSIYANVKRAEQGLITEYARKAIDAGGNTQRTFWETVNEIPKESLVYMRDLFTESNQNLAQVLAKEALKNNIKVDEAQSQKTALGEQTAAYMENAAGYDATTNQHKKIYKEATGESLGKDVETSTESFMALESVEAQRVEQRATVMKAKSLNRQFNDMLEEKTGWKSTRVFSQAEAQSLGRKAGKVRLISSSAQDFEGLNYRILARGKRGEEQQQWFEENLYRPLGQAELSTAAYRRRLFQDFAAAKKELKIKGLQDKVADTGFTKEQAVRVYIWNKQDMKVPGTKKGEVALLSRVVKNDPKLQAFADKLISITKQDGYVEPNEAWAYGSISTDLNQGIRANTRTRFLRQFISNVDEIYSEANLNKLEASFGTAYRKSLEKTLTRIKSGRNRLLTGEVDPDASRILNYINNSTGVIMFLNTRSATLQLTSMTNFVNYTDNNIFKAGAAFANQPQYWKDFVTLFNSDYLRDRRGGNKINIAENEITEAANNSKNKAAGVVTYILSKGFLPTQMADSFAIASGGASFYRNRIKTYEKQGFDTKTAERKAYEDFYELAEKSQQSSKPQRISQQQAGPIGRTVLAFANTPSQYARLMEKAYLDLVNNRGSKRANAGKIAYYGAVQNVMFNFLQQAYFTLLNEEEAAPGTAAERRQQEKQKAKTIEMLNGMADSILRGMGWQGAATSTVKNIALDLYKRSKKDRPEYQDSFMEMLDFSPPIGTKLKKVRNAFMAIDKAGGFEKAAKAPLDIDNPYITAGANLTAGVANIPLDRLQTKIQNIQGVMDEQNEEWQRLMMFLGWPDWQLDMEKARTQQRSTQDNLKLKNIRLPKIKL